MSTSRVKPEAREGGLVDRQSHALYRFFSGSGELLYVGITLSPRRRLREHSESKTWWTDVANITIEHYPDRPAVLKAERDAILTERPIHNVIYNRNHASELQTLEDWPAVVDVRRACKVLGISDSHGYALARRNEFPCRVLRIGGSYRVVTASLVAHLQARLPAA